RLGLVAVGEVAEALQTLRPLTGLCRLGLIAGIVAAVGNGWYELLVRRQRSRSKAARLPRRQRYQAAPGHELCRAARRESDPLGPSSFPRDVCSRRRERRRFTEAPLNPVARRVAGTPPGV